MRAPAVHSRGLLPRGSLSESRYKGENGIMKKKFNSLMKDIEEQKDEVRVPRGGGGRCNELVHLQVKVLQEKERQLNLDRETLQKEIEVAFCLARVRCRPRLCKCVQSLRGVIHDRDISIGEKEKKIYELKKRNQELEKFKFVLDYKIKELKRQIEPRENEIADMRVQIKEVRSQALSVRAFTLPLCGRLTLSWRHTTGRMRNWT